MYFINPQTGWVIKTSGSIYKTTNEGNNWIFLDSLGNVPSLTCIGFIDSNTGWIGTVNPLNLFYKSTNGGINWFPDSSLPSPVPTGINRIFITDNSNIFLIGSSNSPSYFIKSTDRGIHWSGSDMSSLATILLDCHFLNELTGFAFGGIGSFPAQTKPVILYTSDGGQSWETKYTGTRNQSWCWQSSFPGSMTGYACIESFGPPSTFLKTTNGGMNWTELTFRTSPGYSQQAIGFINTSTGWLGGWSDSTFTTANGGLSWQYAGFGVNMSRFKFFGDSIGYASGQYIYKYDKSTGIINTNTNISNHFILYQNYPNPFNPVTTIKFNIPVSGNLTLNVYDMLGREIRTMTYEYISSGTHTINFDANGLSSGVYFYKLETNGVDGNNFIMTNRMILLR